MKLQENGTEKNVVHIAMGRIGKQKDWSFSHKHNYSLFLLSLQIYIIVFMRLLVANAETILIHR